MIKDFCFEILKFSNQHETFVAAERRPRRDQPRKSALKFKLIPVDPLDFEHSVADNWFVQCLHRTLAYELHNMHDRSLQLETA